MPSRHMRLLRQSGMPCATAFEDCVSWVNAATSTAVTKTGTDHTTNDASHEPTSGKTTGSVSDALSNSPTSSPFDQKPVARVMARGNQIRTSDGNVGCEMLMPAPINTVMPN